MQRVLPREAASSSGRLLRGLELARRPRVQEGLCASDSFPWLVPTATVLSGIAPLWFLGRLRYSAVPSQPEPRCPLLPLRIIAWIRPSTSSVDVLPPRPPGFTFIPRLCSPFAFPVALREDCSYQFPDNLKVSNEGSCVYFFFFFSP